MPRTHQRASISTAGAGDNTVISAIQGRGFRLRRLVLWARVAVNVILKDGASPINGAGWNMPAQSGFVYDGGDDGTEITPGNPFVINTDAEGALTGWVEYRTEP